MPYEMIDHTADMGIKVSAHGMRALFEEAARALIEVLGAHIESNAEEVSVITEGIDKEDILVRWLQEILYEIEVQDFRIAFVRIDTLDDTMVAGKLYGEHAPTPLAGNIKAVTYHNITIKRVDKAFETTIIFDA
jgi:SHS2 domain-containing protein